MDLSAAVVKHENLAHAALQRSTVATTNRENYDKAQVKKLGIGEESRAYFLSHIKKYKDLLVNSTGFVDPTNNQEVNLRLVEITCFFSDPSSSACLWIVTPNAGISIGGIQTSVQFPLFLEYYVLGRNAQLARGPAPPFYDKLVNQIQDYLANHKVQQHINPFAQTIRFRGNFGSDDETMHTYDDDLIEMEHQVPGANPLPNPTDLDIDSYTGFVQDYVNLYMPVSTCMTPILIYLTMGGHQIVNYRDFRRVYKDAALDSQHQLGQLSNALGPIAQYGTAGDRGMVDYEQMSDSSLTIHCEKSSCMKFISLKIILSKNHFPPNID